MYQNFQSGAGSNGAQIVAGKVSQVQWGGGGGIKLSLMEMTVKSISLLGHYSQYYFTDRQPTKPGSTMFIRQL